MSLKWHQNALKGNSELPVVCVLIGGGVNSLHMVKFAMENHIPVIIIKGSGGLADVLNDVLKRASITNERYRDVQGRVRTRSTKIPREDVKEHYEHKILESLRRDCTDNVLGQSPEVNQNGDIEGRPQDTVTERKVKDALNYIFERLDSLTVYSPSVSTYPLVTAIMKGLLKDEVQRKEILETIKTPVSASKTNLKFLDSRTAMVDMFIEAVRQDRQEIVQAFMDQFVQDTSYWREFHMGRVLRLYRPDAYTELQMADVRRQFRKLLKNLAVLPLRCYCDICWSCGVDTHTDTPEKQWTCMHPVQELFLWCVYNKRVELAKLFWNYCDDKIAAALVAWTVLKSLKQSEEDSDVRSRTKQIIRCFRTLAVESLKSCHEVDEKQTEALLTKPCPWWGGLSVLQIALSTENRRFMAQSACKKIMTRIWRGDPPENPGRHHKGPSRLMDLAEEDDIADGDNEEDKVDRWFKAAKFWLNNWWYPKRKYYVNVFLQFTFLLLFSYDLLTDFVRPSSTFWVLVVWVAAITVEEVRQFILRTPLIKEARWLRQHRSCWHRFWHKWRMYSRQLWNALDIVTVVLFWLGLMALSSHKTVHITGRVILSLDIFFFFARTFQMFLVHDELGLLLIMVLKMGKDTLNFIAILLMFVLAYAVSSEALLYPESSFTWQRLFYLPSKAYWHVFGEIFLEEIQPTDEEECSGANTSSSSHFGVEQPHCPTEYGRYFVPVMLGIYMFITQILLVNLLIARFGETFKKVYNEAVEYQAWHRCDIITEFYCRAFLPPPFNILQVLYEVFRYLLPAINAYIGPSKLCKKCSPGGSRCCCLCPESRDGCAEECRDMLCCCSPVTESKGERRDEKKEEVFYVAKLKPSLRLRRQQMAFTVWDLDPDCEYTVKVEGSELRESKNRTATRSREYLQTLRDFEAREIESVMDQLEGDPFEELKMHHDSDKTAMLDQLGQYVRERTDRLENKMKKLSRKVKGGEETANKASASLKSGLGDLKKLFRQLIAKQQKQLHELQGQLEEQQQHQELQEQQLRLEEQRRQQQQQLQEQQKLFLQEQQKLFHEQFQLQKQLVEEQLQRLQEQQQQIEEQQNLFHEQKRLFQEQQQLQEQQNASRE